jgi:hypothetical protein
MKRSNLNTSESQLEVRNPPSSPPGNQYRPIWEALAVGLLLGFADSNHAGRQEFALFANLAGGAVLGLRHAGRACRCWPVLGISLYAVHVVAITFGRKPPYVEETYRFAEQCLWIFIPSGLGLIVGVGVRVVLGACGRFCRGGGPSVEFIPNTTRDVMITVACVGIGLGCLHRVIFPPTIYAAKYDEARFHAIREGMSTEHVISALGEPIQKFQWSEDGLENWAYSTGYTDTSNYERRWILGVWQISLAPSRGDSQYR